MKRTQSSENESLSGWIAKAGKDLVTEYGQAKADKLIEKRTEAGLYYEHEDFPGDPMERFYYMRKAKELTHREKTTDSSTVAAEENLNSDMLRALVDENEGAFRAGGLPQGVAASAAGQKALLDGLVEGGVQVAPKKKAKKEEKEGSEAAKPKTQQEIATDLMTNILAESSAARKKSMSLGAVNYAGELASQLLSYAQKMEKYYKILQQATTSQVSDDGFYDKWFRNIEKERKWYVNASVRGWKNSSSLFSFKSCIFKSSNIFRLFQTGFKKAPKTFFSSRGAKLKFMFVALQAAADSILSGLKRASKKKTDKVDKDDKGDKGEKGDKGSKSKSSK